MAEILNPRGGIAKELETSVRRAGWLAVMCEHWLSYKRDDVDAARSDEPTYNLPKGIPQAERFNKARKGCTAYEPRGKLKGGAQSTYAHRWDWSATFDHWFDGGLDRSIKVMTGYLPEQNVAAIEKELAK